MDYNFEKIKTIILELPEKEQLILMKLAETGFQEWNHPEEDIYDMENYKNDFIP